MAQTKKSMVIQDGRRAGRNAASWCFDGNTDDATYQRVLDGLKDGDPEVLDMFRVPNLSGEYAGDPTPQTLANDYDIPEDAIDDYCMLWEDAATSAFWEEVEKTCRAQLRK